MDPSMFLKAYYQSFSQKDHIQKIKSKLGSLTVEYSKIEFSYIII